MSVSESSISCILQDFLSTTHFYSFCLWCITCIYSLTHSHSLFSLHLPIEFVSDQFLLFLFCSICVFFLLLYFFHRRPGIEFNGCRHCHHFWQVRTYDRSSWSLSMSLIWMDLHISSTPYWFIRLLFFLHSLFHLGIYESFISSAISLPSLYLISAIGILKMICRPKPGPIGLVKPKLSMCIDWSLGKRMVCSTTILGCYHGINSILE